MSACSVTIFLYLCLSPVSRLVDIARQIYQAASSGSYGMEMSTRCKSRNECFCCLRCRESQLKRRSGWAKSATLDILSGPCSMLWRSLSFWIFFLNAFSVLIVLNQQLILVFQGQKSSEDCKDGLTRPWWETSIAMLLFRRVLFPTSSRYWSTRVDSAAARSKAFCRVRLGLQSAPIRKTQTRSLRLCC